jgi:vacuolar-type H+-ATPase subunit H
MSAKRNEHDSAEARTKLTRLLETEDELETMLGATRKEADAVVEEARRASAELARDFEKQLEEEDARLRGRIAEERDVAIDAIRRDARDYANRMDAIDDARIDALARQILELLVPESGSGGAS